MSPRQRAVTLATWREKAVAIRCCLSRLSEGSPRLLGSKAYIANAVAENCTSIINGYSLRPKLPLREFYIKYLPHENGNLTVLALVNMFPLFWGVNCSDKLREEVVEKVVVRMHENKHKRGRGYLLEERRSYDTGTSTHGQLHGGHLLVDLFHEVDDEVNELVLEHFLGVEVGDEERDVVTLSEKT